MPGPCCEVEPWGPIPGASTHKGMKQFEKAQRSLFHHPGINAGAGAQGMLLHKKGCGSWAGGWLLPRVTQQGQGTRGTHQQGWTLTHPVARLAPWVHRCTSQKRGHRCWPSCCPEEHPASHRSCWLPWLSPSSLFRLERDGESQLEAR